MIVVLALGVIAYELGTQTKTMRIDFSYSPENHNYFADASLPVTIKNVSLHVEFAVTAIPKVTMTLAYEGVPVQVIQGDFRIDTTAVGELIAALQNLNGKSVQLYLKFDPDISTLSLPYLEIQYVPISLGLMQGTINTAFGSELSLPNILIEFQS